MGQLLEPSGRIVLGRRMCGERNASFVLRTHQGTAIARSAMAGQAETVASEIQGMRSFRSSFLAMPGTCCAQQPASGESRMNALMSGQ